MADYSPGGFTDKEMERNRAVALAHSEGFKVSINRESDWACPQCGANVNLFNIGTHVDWHNTVNTIKSQLFYMRSTSGKAL